MASRSNAPGFIAHPPFSLRKAEREGGSTSSVVVVTRGSQLGLGLLPLAAAATDPLLFLKLLITLQFYKQIEEPTWGKRRVLSTKDTTMMCCTLAGMAVVIIYLHCTCTGWRICTCPFGLFFWVVWKKPQTGTKGLCVMSKSHISSSMDRGKTSVLLAKNRLWRQTAHVTFASVRIFLYIYTWPRGKEPCFFNWGNYFYIIQNYNIVPYVPFKKYIGYNITDLVFFAGFPPPICQHRRPSKNTKSLHPH